MENKDYKRLTDTGIPTITPDDVYNRLYELENAIENGTLVFLPCKVGDEFWWICRLNLPNTLIKEIVTEIIISEDEICIIDGDGVRWHLNEIYFTKDAVEKALEELEK